jgi:hypothetical protein
MVENARALVDQKTKPSPDAKQGGAGTSDPQKKDASPLDPDQLATKLGELETKIRPLPIGWPDQDMKNRLRSAHGCSAAFLYLMKILGLLMSALAVSLGAPFWFDTLSKFMNVRGAGAKPDPVKKTAGGTSVGGGKA